MISDEALDLAVTQGVITADQAQALRSLAADLLPPPPPFPPVAPPALPPPLPAAAKSAKSGIGDIQAARPDDEALRFVTSFADIFVSLGLVLFFGASAYLLKAYVGATGMWAGLAVLSWIVAEFFSRRRRQALPSIILLGLFSVSVFMATTRLIADLNPTAPLNWWHPIDGQWWMLTHAPSMAAAGLATAALTGLHYLRFRVPITIAAMAAALVATVIGVAFWLIPDIDGRMFNGLLFLSGILVFLLAMRFDMSDLQRLTRRTDIAFWLHLLAAPLIVHPLITSIGRQWYKARHACGHGGARHFSRLRLGVARHRQAGLARVRLDLCRHSLRHFAEKEWFRRPYACRNLAHARPVHPSAQRPVASLAASRPQAAAGSPGHPPPTFPCFGIMTDFSPREIVSELDRFIVGQKQAKRAVAIALRNRWRRLRLEGAMRDEVMPKNILMIGPTGCGKTEISRRLAKLANAPFLKVEATKFTEVGYVGRDVEQIIRDLVEIAISMVKQDKRKALHARATLAAEERLLDALVGANASRATRDAFRKKLRDGELADKEVELELAQPSSGLPMFELPNFPGASIGAISIGDIFGKSMGKQTKLRRTLVKDAYEPLIAEESDKLMDQDQIVQQALHEVENNGIVFLDEIDKICGREGRSGADVSREGVQRDLSALDRGHDGVDQARRGEDGPYSLHRVGRLPCRQAFGSLARAAGPAADPRRARLSGRRRFPPHSRRYRGEPHQAI